MESLVQDLFRASVQVKQDTLAKNQDAIVQAAGILIDGLKSGGKVLVCGNGGSAADSQHIAAELVGRFQKERRALPAIALTTDTSILTALANDYSYDKVFARQIEALGQAGDVLIAISTSGGSKNVLAAVHQARQQGLATISLTGGDGGELAGLSDISLLVPSKVTARIQEAHMLMYHILCELVENALSSDGGAS